MLGVLVFRSAVQPAYSPVEYAFSCSVDMLTVSRTRSSAAQPAFNTA